MYKEARIGGLSDIPEGAKEKVLYLEDLVFDKPPVRMEVQGLPTTKTLILDGELTNSIHIGAAEPEQTALVLDIGGVRRSAFTWALEKVAQPGMSVENFETAIAAMQKTVTDHHHPQIAVRAEEKSRRLFT